MLVFLQSANGEQTEKFTFIKQIGKFQGTAQYVVSVTEGRHWGPQAEKNEVINPADPNTERLTLFKRFLHDRKKIIYKQKPKLGKLRDEGTKLNSKKNI